MKKYRIIYYLGSMTTEKYVRAENKKDAELTVRKLIGDKKIISIEETE